MTDTQIGLYAVLWLLIGCGVGWWAKWHIDLARGNTDLENAERTVRAWHKAARGMCDAAIKGDCKAVERLYFDSAMSITFYGADPDPLPSQRAALMTR